MPALEALLHGQFAAQRRHYALEYPDAEHSLVRVDDAAVGQLYVHRTVDVIRVVDMSLLAAYRGQGIGTELLGMLQAEAAARRVPLRLSVLGSNPAQRLYFRLGFLVCGTDGVYLELEWRADRPAIG